MTHLQSLTEKANHVTDALGYPLDEFIKPLVVLLNYHNVQTLASCEGHTTHGLPYPWIDCNINHLPQFIKLLTNFLSHDIELSFLREENNTTYAITRFRIIPSTKELVAGQAIFAHFQAYIEKTTEELAEEVRKIARHDEEKRKWEEYETRLALLQQEQAEREPPKPLPAWTISIVDKFYAENPYVVFDVNPGEYFLFQEFDSCVGDKEMYRPVLAMCVEFDVYDQAGVIRYIEFPRTWESKKLGHRRTSVIRETVLWDFSMYVFEKWVGKPSWKEILAAYRTTFYYGKPKRVNAIDVILRDLDEV